MDRDKRAKTLSEISQTQKERLSHIDFRLMYLGVIQRTDLIQRFGTKEAAATRDIALYRKLAPNNIIYNTKERSYFYQPQFIPLFDYTSERVLAALSSGFGDDFVGVHAKAMINCEAPAQLNTTQLETLAVLTRAIHQHQVVSINYFSLSNGISKREVVPFALVDNGLRWHIRAYDRKRARFTDFVINRIDNPKVIHSTIKEHEIKEADNQWNRIVELEIIPHPALKHPETIAMEYGMNKSDTQKGCLNVNVRAAVAGYLLRRWNIDCSQQHSLKGDEYHLWLKNYPTLYGVDNLIIAPGYQEP
ncbi:MAG: WYL domain-containing protein [gamma proteobacterium symbiont of Bathyaustriella thionipta]|nr:WYL domain-containing protein [gamma proteobacterium symbiont of Bathyaustriella thionipta]MCU7951316.1 WYL domain-containing protein [gamma proteobacterium symbiont of Bathyaustriella thionipta]MCU7952034.1 WYL domain-containing protein [gamma proteobacterium symbiont of Bathyaustriella thionipta]MCU7957850.1 WYL domain-containing protein [gamma proteobacterium symbiont of Bathyaustriella thionipta]MCU7967834.1 WYL domain-containing protein [gamma proteobacterium symbiont of Bathyaustriella